MNTLSGGRVFLTSTNKRIISFSIFRSIVYKHIIRIKNYMIIKVVKVIDSYQRRIQWKDVGDFLTYLLTIT